MQVTTVYIKLAEEVKLSGLRAFAEIVLDGDFAVHDLKIIDGRNGLFVSMPSRKLMMHCEACETKNAKRSLYCNQCGAKLCQETPLDVDSGNDREELYCDVAHSITSDTRETIREAVLSEYFRVRRRGHSSSY